MFWDGPFSSFDQVRCSVCGSWFSSSGFSISNHILTAQSLDMRPGGNSSHSFYKDVFECPKCHYASHNIFEVTDEVKAFILSGAYQKILDEDKFQFTMNYTASKFSKSAYLYFYQKEITAAALDYLYAAWVCDDVDDSVCAKMFREAVDYMLTEYEGEIRMPEHVRVCIHADVARRSGNFSKVFELHEKYELDNDDAQLILDYERKLALASDTRAHGVDEVLPKNDEPKSKPKDEYRFLSCYFPFGFGDEWVKNFKKKSIEYYWTRTPFDELMRIIIEPDIFMAVMPPETICGISDIEGYQNDTPQVIILMQKKSGYASGPQFIYDGGDFAYFDRNDDAVVIVSGISDDVREAILASSSVFIAEVKDIDKHLSYPGGPQSCIETVYEVPVIMVDALYPDYTKYQRAYPYYKDGAMKRSVKEDVQVPDYGVDFLNKIYSSRMGDVKNALGDEMDVKNGVRDDADMMDEVGDVMDEVGDEIDVNDEAGDEMDVKDGARDEMEVKDEARDEMDVKDEAGDEMDVKDEAGDEMEVKDEVDMNNELNHGAMISSKMGNVLCLNGSMKDGLYVGFSIYTSQITDDSVAYKRVKRGVTINGDMGRGLYMDDKDTADLTTDEDTGLNASRLSSPRVDDSRYGEDSARNKRYDEWIERMQYLNWRRERELWEKERRERWESDPELINLNLALGLSDASGVAGASDPSNVSEGANASMTQEDIASDIDMLMATGIDEGEDEGDEGDEKRFSGEQMVQTIIDRLTGLR